jgi:eukaryotic-like serine/threonine-protein kinase
MVELSHNDFKILTPVGTKFRRKFNDVYLCEHKNKEFKSILKHLIKTDKNSHHQQMLLFEGNLRFEHPNLPKTYLIHETNEELFVFKSYADGITLNEFFTTLNRSNKTLFLKEFICKIKPQFDELKEKKLVHSDIKPSNIIIKGTIENFEVFLIDFGLAFYPKDYHRKLVFSLAYSSPELILNKLSIADHTSDIFSLGISIWQLLEGKLPLTHPNPAIMTNLQLTHPLPNGSKITEKWSKILAKMCAKKPFPKPPNLLIEEEIKTLLIEGQTHRYQSLGEVIADLEQVNSTKQSLFQYLVKIFSKS